MILAILDADLARPRSLEMLTAPVLGQPMIWRMVERIRAARTVGKVVVATRRDPGGDALCGYLTARGATVYRGDTGDLLGGYAACARSAGDPSHVVAVNAVTPLVDPGVIDEAVRFALASRAAFVANNGPATYPRGLEVGAITADALLAAVLDAGPADRDSLSAFVQNRPARFETAYFRARRDWSAIDLTAETAAGYTLVCGLFQALHAADPLFGLEDMVRHIERHPQMVSARTSAA